MNASPWPEQLIALYCFVCHAYETHLWIHAERQSPNRTRPAFTDEEALTVYLFGLLRQPAASVGSIHRFTRDFLSEFFPRLPSYSAFNHRLGFLEGVFHALAGELLDALPPGSGSTHLLDSMPVLLAQGTRACSACVAPEVCTRGYCATKQTFFWGVKLHALCLHTSGHLPRPERLWISSASESDLTLAKQHSAELPPGELYADKLYQDGPWKEQLATERQLRLHTPVRRARNAPPLDATDRLYGRAVSRVRQSVETLFSWLDRVSGIQDASRVRSTAGLWVHIFGRLCVAFLLFLAKS
jgi:hypothetical protein